MSQNVADDIPETGAVFTFGKSRFADNEPSHFFIKNDPIISISCGDEHSAVICQQGRVFVFGANSFGQLGLGHTDEVTRPSCVKWLKPQKTIFVACGRAHTIFVTDTYAIYTVGCNDEGQLGTGNTENQCVPQYIDLDCDDVRIRQVSAGSNHTVILTEGGRVFVCGSNTEGQLGLGEDVKMSTNLTELKFAEIVVFIECGYYHTVFITEKGAVFLTGDNEGEKLGISDGSLKIFLPRLLSIDMPIKSVCCGSSHTFLLSECETKVLALGSNELGQLGLSKDVTNVTTPTQIPLEKMFDGHLLKLVSCGAFHTSFVTDNGIVYTCGEARSNKLCLENLDNTEDPMANQYEPKKVDAMSNYMVDNVACGGCHTIMTAVKVNDNLEKESMVSMKPTENILETPAMMNESSIQNSKESEIKNTMNDESKNLAIDDSSELLKIAGAATSSMGTLLDNGKKVITDKVADVKEKVTEAGEMINKQASESVKAVEETIEDSVDTLSKNAESIINAGSNVANDMTNKIVTGVKEAKESVQNTGKELMDDIKDAANVLTDKHITDKTLDDNLDNETIYCDSDTSDNQNMRPKMQAVMPTLRGDDKLTNSEEMKEIKGPKKAFEEETEKKGPFSRFIKSFQDKENFCMGKAKVVENKVTETVTQGISVAEDTVHKVEENIMQEVHNQTNSKTCIIL